MSSDEYKAEHNFRKAPCCKNCANGILKEVVNKGHSFMYYCDKGGFCCGKDNICDQYEE